MKTITCDGYFIYDIITKDEVLFGEFNTASIVIYVFSTPIGEILSRHDEEEVTIYVPEYKKGIGRVNNPMYAIAIEKGVSLGGIIKKDNGDFDVSNVFWGKFIVYMTPEEQYVTEDEKAIAYEVLTYKLPSLKILPKLEGRDIQRQSYLF